jgi:hypothetical protein
MVKLETNSMLSTNFNTDHLIWETHYYKKKKIGLFLLTTRSIDYDKMDVIGKLAVSEKKNTKIIANYLYLSHNPPRPFPSILL